MYADKDKNPVQDKEAYVGSDGTLYPRNFPKSQIKELRKVTETPRPTGKSIHVTGFHIDNDFVQVWEVKPKTNIEMRTAAIERWESQMAELSNIISDEMEHHIRLLHGGVTGNPRTQIAYDAKRKLRENKPK